MAPEGAPMRAFRHRRGCPSPRAGNRKEVAMSAPRTNIETQKRRHRGPLLGMIAAVLFGVILIGYWLIEEVATADNPTEIAPGAQDTGAPAVSPTPLP
jgi:hypothetical protein